MEIWDVIKGLFMLFVLIPLFIAVIYFLGLRLPFLIILCLYDYVTYKIYQYFKIDTSGWLTMIICTLFVGFFYILALYLLAVLFMPMGNWEIIPMVIIGTIVYLIFKKIEELQDS
ncbi:hypothetical protein [Staphylococcus kloosii]|jgi:hypothetical protein|uniref:hypothetical protein n=1 Tax=Staphylococcus kloosii TaxID=29384 RepID=UPI00189E63BD|nr:hypothetical protein [Staphylococcus kloosii]MBF7025225.1 hypothetical protein [Staphylococcus kloosii]